MLTYSLRQTWDKGIPHTSPCLIIKYAEFAQGMFSALDLEKGVATAAAAAVTSALGVAAEAATLVAASKAAAASAARLAQTAGQAKADKQGQASDPAGMDAQVGSRAQ